MEMVIPPEPLVGAELLSAVEKGNRQGMDKRSVILACGYASRTADGRRFARATAFYEALFAAKGMQVGAVRTTGRRLSFQTRVQANGNVLVHRSYTERLGLLPGTGLVIEEDLESRSLVLHRRDPDLDDDAGEDDA